MKNWRTFKTPEWIIGLIYLNLFVLGWCSAEWFIQTLKLNSVDLKMYEGQRTPIILKHKTEVLASWEITGYCLKGIMASGKKVHDGAVACPAFFKLGTKIKIEGREYTCEDRMAKQYRNGNYIDKWYSSCDDALKWGRRKVDIEKL